MYRFTWIIFFGSLAIIESVSSAATMSSDTAVLRPDPFVEAAPLIVAVACRNGAVIIAAHTLGTDEPLIYDSWLPEDSEDKGCDERVESTSCAFRNLPADYKGPFRIHSVDRYGSALVSSGWRADCEVLVEKCRSLCQIELNRFGPPSQLDGNYANMIATDLSCYLAQCAVSERVCAKLFAIAWEPANDITFKTQIVCNFLIFARLGRSAAQDCLSRQGPKKVQMDAFG